MNSFHFLRPAWLLALPPLVGFALWQARRRRESGAWSRLIEPGLLARLRIGQTARGGSPWPLLGLGWALASLALAGPTWQQQRVPAYRVPGAWVVVLDLSPSMAASDVPPNRVTRARYAIENLLSAAHDARVALVVFSDEAYTVTPLTSDVATIRDLLGPLAPSLMPAPGNALSAALRRAGRLLKASRNPHGRVIVFTDGFNDPAQAMLTAQRLHRRGVSVDVVGVGTARGAPEPDPRGGFAHDAGGHVVMARLNADPLERVAAAGGGRYFALAQMPTLVAQLQRERPAAITRATRAPGLRVASWRNDGIWLLPPLLLLAALLARRGWL